ncbi:MAG TPA: hypothetical protein VJL27_02445 [Patescibacteria group bacterium]|nr:hypothetical protein [Patescibacteria group bacterium]
MKVLWIILVVLSVVGSAAGGFFYSEAKNKKRVDSLQAQITELTNSSISSTTGAAISDSSATTSTNSSATNLTAAKAVVTKYLDAKKTRSLANAKPYMTATLYNSTNQEEFAGASSPGLSSYTITAAEYLENADLYRVTAKLTYTLQGADAGYYINNYMVENTNGQFLVNEVKDGAWTEI